MEAKQIKKWDVNWKNFWVNLMTVLGAAGRENIYGHTSVSHCQTCLAKAYEKTPKFECFLP